MSAVASGRVPRLRDQHWLVLNAEDDIAGTGDIACNVNCAVKVLPGFNRSAQYNATAFNRDNDICTGEVWQIVQFFLDCGATGCEISASAKAEGIGIVKSAQKHRVAPIQR
jgi:hypothetical protein